MNVIYFFNKKIGPNPAQIRRFLNTMKNLAQFLLYKSIDGALGIRSWDYKMVGEDESTELRRPPIRPMFCVKMFASANLLIREDCSACSLLEWRRLGHLKRVFFPRQML